MKRFKRILVATDLSAASASTVRYAAHLAKSQGARLTIVHVPPVTSVYFPYYEVPIDTGRIDREIEEDARKKLARLERLYFRMGIPTTVVVRYGIIHEVLCKVANDVAANLLVMATHGRKGVGHAVLGSVTERVLRDAPCPVLVVRPPKPVIRVKKAA